MIHTVHYIGGPRDGMRECRDESCHELQFPELVAPADLCLRADGDEVATVVRRHSYIKRPVGRDEWGREVFVAIHAPMLARP